ncbi:Uncharacterised protein [Brucella anthropi]|nr:Uncharacterised protein [Brucella anthropi]
MLWLELVDHLVGISRQKVDQLLAERIEHWLRFRVRHPGWLVRRDEPVEEQHGNDNEKHTAHAAEQEAERAVKRADTAVDDEIGDLHGDQRNDDQHDEEDGASGGNLRDGFRC